MDFTKPLLQYDDERHILNDYTPSILGEVVKLFEIALPRNNFILLEELLACISTISATLDTDFG